MRRGKWALLCMLWAAAGCLVDDPDDDDTHPRIIDLSPASAEVPVTATFTIRFSEALRDNTVDGDPTSEKVSVVIVTQEAFGDGDAFRSDLNNPPLSDSRIDDLVAIDVALTDDDTTIEATPRANLAAGTGYVLLLSSEIRDLAGNPMVDNLGAKASFAYSFHTDSGPPAVTTTSVDAGTIAPNTRRIDITFNQPVNGVTSTSLRLEGTGTANVASVLVSATRDHATLILAEPTSGCSRLTPSASYTLVATDDITGDNGQALTPLAQGFTAGGACDNTQNHITSSTAVAGEVDATVLFDTSKASTTEVRFGVSGAALDCLGAACPVLGDDARTAVSGSSPARFAHVVHLTGLTLNVSYDVVIVAEDDVGSVATTTKTFQTAPLPKIAINEFLADAASGVDDADGEFIELVSFESAASHDLSGWKVEETTGTGVKTCTLPSPGPVLAAQGFIVMAGPDFDASIYDNVPAQSIVNLSSWCGLNNEGITLVLKDNTGRPISSVSTPMSPKSGRSIERTSPSAADAAASFCYSRSDAGPTPGRQNSVVASGCDE